MKNEVNINSEEEMKDLINLVSFNKFRTTDKSCSDHDYDIKLQPFNESITGQDYDIRLKSEDQNAWLTINNKYAKNLNLDSLDYFKSKIMLEHLETQKKIGTLNKIQIEVFEQLEYEVFNYTKQVQPFYKRLEQELSDRDKDVEDLRNQLRALEKENDALRMKLREYEEEEEDEETSPTYEDF